MMHCPDIHESDPCKARSPVFTPHDMAFRRCRSGTGREDCAWSHDSGQLIKEGTPIF